jgi:branched-chain amino acid transport system permease protein
MWEFYLVQLSNGAVMGLIYALAAVGLTLIFSVLRVINFAHGEFYMLGGYAFWYLLTALGLHPVLAVPLAILIVHLIGSVFEFSLLRPTHLGKVERPVEYAILITFSLVLILQNAAILAFGPFPKRPPSFLPGRITIGPITMVNDRLIAAGLAIVFMLTLLVIVKKTWVGKGLRAVSQDKDAAAIVGINPFRMNTLAFGIGTALAAGAGIFIAPLFSVTPDGGALVAVRSFVIIVLGGIGSIKGAILGGLIIGLTEGAFVAFYPDITRATSYSYVASLLIFALVLLLRPTGLFGREQ